MLSLMGVLAAIRLAVARVTEERRAIERMVVMTGPIGFAFRTFDALLGVAFACALFVGVVGLFLLGGAPKKYEIDALGGAYTSVLETLEGTARDLRENYCAQADDASRREARCGALAARGGLAG